MRAHRLPSYLRPMTLSRPQSTLQPRHCLLLLGRWERIVIVTAGQYRRIGNLTLGWYFIRNRWTRSTTWRMSVAKTGISATRCTTRSAIWSRTPVAVSTRCRLTLPRPKVWSGSLRPPYWRRPASYRRRHRRSSDGTGNSSRPQRIRAKTHRCWSRKRPTTDPRPPPTPNPAGRRPIIHYPIP